MAIWYILAEGVYHTIPLIKEMFYDLELEEECTEILDKFPWMTSDIDASVAENKTNNMHDPGSHNCAIFVLYTVSIFLSFTSRV